MRMNKDELGGRPLLMKSSDFAYLASFWFAYHFFWTAILPYVIPSMAERLGGADWGIIQWIFLSLGALFSAFVQLTIGFVSDHTISPLGKRKPYIIVGVLLFIPSVIYFFNSMSFASMLIGYLLLQLSVNIAAVPYQAILPDLVVHSRHGMASAFMGLFDLMGKLTSILVVNVLFTLPTLLGSATLVSAFAGREFDILIVLYIAFFVILSSLLIVKIPSYPSVKASTDIPLFSIRRFIYLYFEQRGRNLFHTILKNYLDFRFGQNINFIFLLLSRTLVYFGFYVFIPNVYHFVRYNLGLNPDTYSPILLALVIILAVPGNLIGGYFSDKVGKKPVVAASLLILMGFMFPLIYARSFGTSLILGAAVGIGWGMFISADWAFACTLIPKKRTARYMGIWDLSTLIPQVIATMLTGLAHAFLIRVLGGAPEARQAQALQIIFSSAFLFFLLGLLILRFVKEERFEDSLAKI